MRGSGHRFLSVLVIVAVVCFVIARVPRQSLAQSLTAAERADRICGPHALFLFLRLCGVEVTYERALNYMPTDPSGMSMLQLRDACSELGLPAEVRRCTVEDAPRLPFPVLAHFTQKQPGRTGHYVVWTRLVDENRIEMLDSTTGKPFTWPIERLPELWEGWVLMRAERARDTSIMWIAAIVGPWLLVAIAARWMVPAFRRASDRNPEPTISNLNRV
jgi:ABC-type bacteriocin/lantibiotic exporter with double-glycine peptidase domain